MVLDAAQLYFRNFIILMGVFLLSIPEKLFGVEGGDPAALLITSVITSTFCSVAGAAPAFGGDFNKTKNDPIRQIKASPAFEALVAKIGMDNANGFILDLFAGFSINQLIEKYFKDQSVKTKLLETVKADRDILEKGGEKDSPKDKKLKIDSLLVSRFFIRLMTEKDPDSSKTEKMFKENQIRITELLDRQLSLHRNGASESIRDNR